MLPYINSIIQHHTDVFTFYKYCILLQFLGWKDDVVGINKLCFSLIASALRSDVWPTDLQWAQIEVQCGSQNVSKTQYFSSLHMFGRCCMTMLHDWITTNTRKYQMETKHQWSWQTLGGSWFYTRSIDKCCDSRCIYCGQCWRHSLTRAGSPSARNLIHNMCRTLRTSSAPLTSGPASSTLNVRCSST